MTKKHVKFGSQTTNPLPVSSLLTSSHKCKQLRHEKQIAKQRWQNLLHEDANVQRHSDAIECDFGLI